VYVKMEQFENMTSFETDSQGYTLYNKINWSTLLIFAKCHCVSMWVDNFV